MIHFLLKIFTEKQHAESFLRGDMYANRLSWFRKIGESDGRGDEYEGAVFRKIEESDGRGDEYEGAVMLQRDNLIMNLTAMNKETGEVLSEFTITKDDLAAPPVMQLATFDNLNLFCMYAGHSRDFQPETDAPLQELQKHIEIPEECLQLGRYAVGIKDAPEFLRRIQVAANREGYSIYRGLVEYYDPEVGTPLEPLTMKTALRKRDDFAHQREYRFVIDTGTTGSDAITLNIGDISDIAMPLDPSDMKIRLFHK